MSVFADCKNDIIEIVYNHTIDYHRKTQDLDLAIETMLIFLDYNDLIFIIEKLVIPSIKNDSNYYMAEYFENKVKKFKKYLHIS